MAKTYSYFYHGFIRNTLGKPTIFFYGAHKCQVDEPPDVALTNIVALQKATHHCEEKQVEIDQLSLLTFPND